MPAEHAPFAPPRQDQTAVAYGQYPGGQRPAGRPTASGYGQPGYAQPPFGQQSGAPQQPLTPRERRWSSGPPVPPVVRKRRGSILPSLFFGILALILAGAAVYLYIQQREETGPVAPTAPPGQNGLAQVVDTFNGAGLKTEYAPRTDKYDKFSEPGQAITIDGNDAWVFVYANQDEQQADAKKWNPDNPGAITSPSGKEWTTAKPVMYAHSNVIVVVSTDKKPSSDDLSKIEQAVNALP